MSNFVTNQEIREQAGFQYKERSEALDPSTGDGSNKIFYTEHKPIVDRTYSGTPVGTPDVRVYGSGVVVVVSSVDGELGKVIVSSTPVSGTPMTIDYDWTNIDDTVLTTYADEAHSLILAKLSEVYSLPLSETPDLLKLIEKKLAAGLLLDKEYSVGGDETEDTRGRRWIKWAEQKLEDIVSGKLELIDSSGSAISQKTTGAGVAGWPDNTTKDEEEADAGGDTKFRIKKEF